MALVQVAQYAADLDRAAAWYTTLLGRGPTARFDPPGLLFFDLDHFKFERVDMRALAPTNNGKKRKKK